MLAQYAWHNFQVMHSGIFEWNCKSKGKLMPIMYIAKTCNTRYMISLILFPPYIIKFLLEKKNGLVNVFNDKL